MLSTCNRTEVYAVAERFHGAYQDIRNFLSELAFVPPEDFGDHLYVHYDARGRPPPVLGGRRARLRGARRERDPRPGPQRPGSRPAQEGAAGPVLNLLFRHALETGKRARTDTGIARGTTSVSHAAVEMAAERLGSLAGRRRARPRRRRHGRGHGRRALPGAGVAEVLVANRTWRKARALADRIGGQAVRLSDLPAALAEVDLLLTSTGATVARASSATTSPPSSGSAPAGRCSSSTSPCRATSTPSVAHAPGVTLLDMDDLRRFAQAGIERRAPGAGRGRGDRRRRDRPLPRRHLGPVGGAAGRRRCTTGPRTCAGPSSTGSAAASRASTTRQRDAVEALTKGIIGKLLHEPTVKLKELAGTPDRRAPGRGAARSSTTSTISSAEP